MMYWGNGVGAWGMVLMIVGTLLFWRLIIAGIVARVRYTSRGPQDNSATRVVTPQHVLADRFARGEIDEEDYGRRLGVLETAARNRRADG